ncbi:MAG: flagellar protein FlgN [Pseudomonadota bacterium]
MSAEVMTPAGNLRQMIAVLERERQALASLDADELMCSSREKEALCDALTPLAPDALDAETRSLAETAQQLNEVNRRVRNLLAANVAARLDAMGGSRATYTPAHFARA